MILSGLDWSIVVLYLVSASYRLLFVRKASQSPDDYFVAGRSLPWLIAGTSMVATSFSADTPLFVAGMSRESVYPATGFGGAPPSARSPLCSSLPNLATH
jgi:Na+/proline symporter